MRKNGSCICVLLFLCTAVCAERGGYALPFQDYSHEKELRNDVFERINARADAFRLSARSSGWKAEDAAAVIRDGLSMMNAEPSPEDVSVSDMENGTDFLLEALNSLEPSEGVVRAKEFIQQERTVRPVSAADAFRRAALGKSSDGLTCDARSFAVLRSWKSSTKILFAAALQTPPQSPFEPVFPHRSTFFAVGNISVPQDFRTALELASELPLFLDGTRDIQSERLPRPDFYHLAAFLPAGRTPVLLI